MRPTIHCADVLDWAAAYQGEPFHALLCDPPYHLTDVKVWSSGGPFNKDENGKQIARSGFMGKSWDGGDIAFRPETWRAFWPLLHPGAFGFAFAGTRGCHRMMTAIEDAGYVIHPVLVWSFGCLSDDTEILTRNGWEPYHKARAGTDVLCYNTASDSLEWDAVQELYTYAYDDTAYRIHSDHTDQIVSRNHRCLVERGGKLVFRYAETLERQEVVPILATVPTVQEAVFSREQRSVSQAAVLFKDVRASGYQFSGIRSAWADSATRKEAARSAQGRNDYVSSLRYAGMEAGSVATQEQDRLLFATLQRHGSGAEARQSPSQRQRQEAAWQRISGCAQSGVEGWRYLFQEAWQLCRRQVCALSRAMAQHGAQGWLRDGASAAGGTSHRAPAATHRSSPSYRPRSAEQCAPQFAVVRQQPRSQVTRASRVAASDLASVTPIHYRGTVWCVRVPTGAFVARRNGHIFITGNSGFPKATRIDTQIDAAAGVAVAHGRAFNAAGKGLRDELYNNPSGDGTRLHEPATDLARAWAGHRYGLQALKPSVEIIVCFQKPYAGRPVESITATGAGALWIDGGRIGTETVTLRGTEGTQKYSGLEGRGSVSTVIRGESTGRWPSNLILQHATLPVLALTAMIQSDVEQRIREYFDGYDRVSNLRKDRQANPSQSEVLQPRMPQRRQSRNGESTASGDDVLVVQEVVSRSSVMGEGWTPEVLQQGMQDSTPVQPHRAKQSALWETEHPERQGTDEDSGTSAGIESDISGRKTSRLEGRDDARGWVSVDNDQSSERSRSSVGATDETEGRVHTGASTGDGTRAGPPADQGRNRSPQERRQARQSTGKPGSTRPGTPFENPSGDDQGNRTTESGKRALEVLACDVPPEWRGYFELTGEDLGCEPIGERRVRTATAVRHTSGGNTFGGTTAKPPMHDMTYADADGYETITAWRCVEGCAVAALSAQSGELTSGALHKETTGWGSHGIYGSGGKPYIAHAEASSGTAARFFYNSNWQAERLEAADAVKHAKCIICGCNALKHGIMSEKHLTHEDIPCDPANGAESNSNQPSEHGDSAPIPARPSGKPNSAGRSESVSIPVSTAESSLKNTTAINASTAPSDATTMQDEQIARSAQSVVSLCASCAIGIARSLAAILQGSDPELPLTQAFMPERKKRILLHSLALLVESRESTDTIPTINDLNTLFGFVSLATESSIPAPKAAYDLPVFLPSSGSVADKIAASDNVLYKSKASTAEREAGLSGRQRQNVNDGRDTSIDNPYQRGDTQRLNTHSTIKPLALVEHLAKLLLPPALYAPRRLFVPFAGAGSEMLGALFAGWEHIEGVELEEDHVSIARSRIEWWEKMMRQTHSSDPGAILKAYGTRDTAKPSSTERWPAGSLFENLEEE